MNEDELKDVIRRFLKQWEIVSPAIDNAFLMMQIHGMPYSGPTIQKELDALKGAVGYEQS